MNITELKVGSPLGGIPKQHAEGPRLVIDGSGLLLLVSLRSPTSAEVRAYKSGVATFALAEREGIIFFLARFGSLAWIDMPYNCRLEPQITLPEVTPGSGYALTTVLHDANGGTVRSVRLIGLPELISRTLYSLIDTQQGDPRVTEDRQVYLHQVGDMMARYTTQDLLNNCIAKA